MLFMSPLIVNSKIPYISHYHQMLLISAPPKQTKQKQFNKKITNKKPGKINQEKKRPRFFLNPRNHVL